MLVVPAARPLSFIRQSPIVGIQRRTSPHEWACGGLRQAIGRSTALTTEPWATLQEVADHLKVSEDTVHRWIATRAMPSHRIGRVWRFKLSDIDAWVRSGPGSDTNDGDGRHHGHP